MHVMLGGSLEEALAALPPDAASRIGELAAGLADPKRSVRARALAAGAEDVARAVQEITLR